MSEFWKQWIIQSSWCGRTRLVINLPSPHPRILACPSTLEMLWAKERTLPPSPFIVITFGLTIESIKELGTTSITQLHIFIEIIHSPCHSSKGITHPLSYSLCCLLIIFGQTIMLKPSMGSLGFNEVTSRAMIRNLKN